MAVGKFHYLHFGGFSFAFTILVAVIIALLTEPIPKEKVCETVINYTVFYFVTDILEFLIYTIIFNIAALSLNILVTP